MYRLSLILLLAWLGIGAVQAASVDITSGGSNGPIVVPVGSPVSFDAVVICDDLLIEVPGSEHPKKGDNSEIAWQIRNDSPSTITLRSFGVDWECLNDPGAGPGDQGESCANWEFLYLKVGNGVPQGGGKHYKDNGPYPGVKPFPVTLFDKNPGFTFDVTPGQVIDIDEMEFVNDADKKFVLDSNTQVRFTVTWEDIDGIQYVQVFTVTWP